VIRLAGWLKHCNLSLSLSSVSSLSPSLSCRELEDSYSRNNSSFRKTRFVCDFSSNDLSLNDVDQFATWLEGNSLRIYALDLSFKRIFSKSWEPILQVVGRLVARVDNLQLGGNCLPALSETDELRKLQHSGCVSLALSITGSPADEWQEEWNNIAVNFGTHMTTMPVMMGIHEKFLLCS